MRSLVVAADAQSGALLEIRPNERRKLFVAARMKGDPQWHAGVDPHSEEACFLVAVAPNEATGLRRSEDLHAMLKHGEALGAV